MWHVWREKGNAYRVVKGQAEGQIMAWSGFLWLSMRTNGRQF